MYKQQHSIVCSLFYFSLYIKPYLIWNSIVRWLHRVFIILLSCFRDFTIAPSRFHHRIIVASPLSPLRSHHRRVVQRGLDFIKKTRLSKINIIGNSTKLFKLMYIHKSCTSRTYQLRQRAPDHLWHQVSLPESATCLQTGIQTNDLSDYRQNPLSLN